MSVIRTDLRVRPKAWAVEVAITPVGGLGNVVNVQDAIEALEAEITTAAGTPPAVVPKQISIANSPYTVQATDYLILVDTSGGAVTINMMAAAARNNLPVEIKDSTGNAQANPISVVRNGAETIDGLATYPMASDFVAFTFKPVTGGYRVI